MTKADHQQHIYEHASRVTAQEREQLLRQRGCVIWFTGLSGSGKSTVAHALEYELIQLRHAAFVLDGDNIRRRINTDLGFSKQDRAENIRRIAEVAGLMADAGLICITAFISPFREDRVKARQVIGTDRFIEIYLCTSLDECERRDPKGLYAKARSGEIDEFTGISSPYEAPAAPELALDTGKLSVAEVTGQILADFRARGILAR